MKKEKIEKRAIQHEKEMKKIKSGTEESEAEKERGNQEVEIAAGSFNNHRKEVSRQKATCGIPAKLILLMFIGITTREEEEAWWAEDLSERWAMIPSRFKSLD